MPDTHVYIIVWDHTAPTAYADRAAVIDSLADVYEGVPEAEAATERERIDTAIANAQANPGQRFDMGDGDTITWAEVRVA